MRRRAGYTCADTRVIPAAPTGIKAAPRGAAARARVHIVYTNPVGPTATVTICSIHG